MKEVLLVGTGGFLGAVSRYLLGGWINRLLHETPFPYATLAINTLGCLLIGFLSGLGEQRQVFTPETRLFIFIGILGGFTTFSTFGYETFALARDGQTMFTLANIFLHFAVCLGAVWMGHLASQLV